MILQGKSCKTCIYGKWAWVVLKGNGSTWIVRCAWPKDGNYGPMRQTVWSACRNYLGRTDGD